MENVIDFGIVEDRHHASGCPFCGGNHIIKTKDTEETTEYHCPDCERDFDADDYEHEVLRQRISAFCSALEADEEHPIDCTADNLMECRISGVDEEAQGLSESDKPLVTKIYHDYEAIVWVEVDGEDIEADDLITSSLSDIAIWLASEFEDIKKTIIKW